MARPKKEESIKRTNNVMVRFSNIEYELVAGYAKDAGYPISTFVRKQALSEKVTVNYNIVADIGEIQKLTAQAAGIGNNLNQIARYFHGGVLFVLPHFLFCAEDAVYIGTHGLEFFVIILEIMVSIVLGVLLNRKLRFFCPEVFHGRKLPVRRVLLQNLKCFFILGKFVRVGLTENLLVRGF